MRSTYYQRFFLVSELVDVFRAGVERYETICHR